jgi:hypothetical protein
MTADSNVIPTQAQQEFARAIVRQIRLLVRIPIVARLEEPTRRAWNWACILNSSLMTLDRQDEMGAITREFWGSNMNSTYRALHDLEVALKLYPENALTLV